MSISIKQLEALQRSGKIKGYKAPERSENGVKLPQINPQSKGLEYIKWNLWYWANQKSLEVEHEFKFHPTRGWRFDFAIPVLKLAVEFEGGVYQQNTSHNSARTFTKDTSKYNAAANMGWRVLRYTAISYRNLIKELNEAYNDIIISKP